MKPIFAFLFSFLVSTVFAQKTILPSDKFSVEGKVKQALLFWIADLDTFKSISLPDVIITNHLGENKHTLTNMKGILLKYILSKAEIDAENPKVLSEFYFEFVATDDYKIVFSWNEIFNTQTGNNIYIIMEEGGKDIREIDGRISIVTLTDFKTGRRHISNISKIIVERVH